MKKVFFLFVLLVTAFYGTAQEIAPKDSIQPTNAVSLEGLTFVAPTTSASGEVRDYYGMLYFTSATEGVITFGWNAIHPKYVYDIKYFTYVINGSKIALTTKEDKPLTFNGDVAGKTGMVLKVGDTYFSYLVWK